MKFKGYKLNIIVVVMLAVISIFFLSQYIYTRYNTTSLNQDILAITGIKDVSITDYNQEKEIKVTLASNINLYQLYHKLERVVWQELDKKKTKILLEYESNQKSEDIYYQMHYALYEAVATNSFVELKSIVSDIANANNIEKYNLWIDSQAIYLQLNENEHALFKRIVRPSFPVNGGGNNG